jgi:1,2-diacylglycerol 3-alpha-glucosyltransferase
MRFLDLCLYFESRQERMCRMRIALFSDVYKPVVNGVVNHVELLKKYFEQLGEQVWLFVPGTPAINDGEKNVIRIPGIPIADTGYHLSVAVDRRSRSLIKQMDVIHVHHPFLSGSFGLSFSRRYNIPLIFTNHTRYDLYVQQYLPRVPGTLSDTALHTFFHLFSGRCSAIIAPSQSIAGIMHDWGVHSKVVVVPNGIELENFQTTERRLTRKDLGIPDEVQVGIFVGRMSGEKSVDRLLTIFAALFEEEPSLHLLLVGGGPDLEEYRHLAHQLEISHKVTFTGKVLYTDVADYLALADFFVSASVTEVHPLTFIEAAAAGLPSVGLASPGVQDMILNGETGYIAADNDLSFGLRILRMVQDCEHRLKMGQRARVYSSQFAAHANARKVLSVYRDCLS